MTRSCRIDNMRFRAPLHWASCRCRSGFINNVIYGLTFGRPNFNRVKRLPVSELGLLSEFCTPMGGSRRATSIYSAIMTIVFSAIISTPLQRHLWGSRPGIAWGDSLFAVMSSPIMHQCGWPHLSMSLSWIFWIKSAYPTWHSSSIVSCRSGWCTSLAVINDD